MTPFFILGGVIAIISLYIGIKVARNKPNEPSELPLIVELEEARSYIASILESADIELLQEETQSGKFINALKLVIDSLSPEEREHLGITASGLNASVMRGLIQNREMLNSLLAEKNKHLA